MRKLNKLGTILMLSLIVLSGCTASKLYQEAKNEKSIIKYEEYLSKYPSNKFYDTAIKELSELKEINAWNTATESRELSNYYNFLNQYPNSAHKKEAENTIEKIKDDNLWSKIKNSEDISLFNQYLTNFPNGLHKNAAKHKLFVLEVLKPYWIKVDSSNNIKEIRAFLKEYPSGEFSNLAHQKLREIESSKWELALLENTVNGFQAYLDEFPESKNSRMAKKKIIDLEVDQIFEEDHGYLPPMNTNTISDERFLTNEIEIYNNTNYTLTVRYSGDKSVRIILTSKEKRTITLPNGNYRVTATVNTNNIQNYAGNDELIGSNYESEFYIETRML